MATVEGIRQDFTPNQVDFYRALKFLSKDRQTHDLSKQANFIVSFERSINAKNAKVVDSYQISFMFDSALTFKDAEEGFEGFFEDSFPSNLAIMRKNVLAYFGFEKINWEEFNSDSVEYKVAKFPKNPNAYLVRTLFLGFIPNHNVLKENIVVAPNEKEFHDFWKAVTTPQPQLKIA